MSRSSDPPLREHGVVQGTTTDELLTVLAHGWLGSMSVIAGAAETLREDSHRLTADQRARLLSMMATQAKHLGAEMRQLVAAANPEVQAALDELLGAALEEGATPPGSGS